MLKHCASLFMGNKKETALKLKSSSTTISVNHRRNVGTEIKFYMKKEIPWESVNDNLQAHYHLNSAAEVHKSRLMRKSAYWFWSRGCNYTQCETLEKDTKKTNENSFLNPSLNIMIVIKKLPVQTFGQMKTGHEYVHVQDCNMLTVKHFPEEVLTVVCSFFTIMNEINEIQA